MITLFSGDIAVQHLFNLLIKKGLITLKEVESIKEKSRIEVK